MLLPYNKQDMKIRSWFLAVFLVFPVVFLSGFSQAVAATNCASFTAQGNFACTNGHIDCHWTGTNCINIVAQPIPPAGATPCNDPGKSALDLASCYALNPFKGTTVADVFGSTPSSLINLTVKVIFISSGIVLFFMLIYSGFLFISEGTKGQEQAQKVLTSATTGFVIVFSAYWIMQIIKLITGADIGF